MWQPAPPRPAPPRPAPWHRCLQPTLVPALAVAACCVLPQDRGRFIQSYTSAEGQLKQVLRQKGRKPPGGDENDMCRMM